MCDPRSQAAAAGTTEAKKIQIWVDGRAVSVLVSYPSWKDLKLHSLAVAARFSCGACRERHESTMVATGWDTLVCPACYAYYSYNDVSLFEQDSRLAS